MTLKTMLLAIAAAAALLGAAIIGVPSSEEQTGEFRIVKHRAY